MINHSWSSLPLIFYSFRSFLIASVKMNLVKHKYYLLCLCLYAFEREKNTHTKTLIPMIWLGTSVSPWNCYMLYQSLQQVSVQTKIITFSKPPKMTNCLHPCLHDFFTNYNFILSTLSMSSI